MTDFENKTQWNHNMDADDHIKTYKGFVYGTIALIVLIVSVLVLMAAFLT